MLQLILLRHAQADYPDHVSDHDRPLSARGHEQARIMGLHIQAQQLIPDLAIVSTAKRTQDTWADVIKAGQIITTKVDEPRIYESSVSNLLEVIKSQDSQHTRLMLLGHNPGLEQLTVWLAESGTQNALTRIQHGFVVGSLAVIDLPFSSWSTLEAQRGTLSHFATPDTAAL